VSKLSKIKLIKHLSQKENCYDVQVNDVKRYFSNGILSHNSSLMDGVCFALFGSVAKNLTLPEIVNEKIGQDCKVSLSFELNGDNYRIDRYAKHTEFRDKVLLFKNEENKSKANKKDTQELIDEVVKINFKSFVNSVMMSQENVGKFLEADPFKKKEIIENILQLNILSQYHMISQQKRKISKRNFDHTSSEMNNYESLIKNTKDSAVAYVNSCKNQKNAAEKKIIDLKNQLSRIENKNIEEERAKIKDAIDAKKLIDEKKLEYKNQLVLVSSVDSQLKTLEDSEDEIKESIRSNEKSIQKISLDIKELEKIILRNTEEMKHAKENPDECPLCKNLINIDEINKWIKEKKSLIDSLSSSMTDKLSTLKEYNEKISVLEEKMSIIQKQKSSIEEKRAELKKNALKIKSDYDSIEIPETMNDDDLNRLSDEINKIKTQIKNLEDVEYMDQSYLDNLINKAKELSSSLKIKKEELQKYKKEVALYQWWENSFSSKKNSMKSWCINNIIGYFNTRIKNYVDRFFDGDTEIQLDIELNEKITRNGFDRSFAQFSGGEKQRLNLAILFALNNLVKSSISTKINIMFLDEILSNSLDDKGVSTVLELLNDMKDNNETVFIIDHKDSFKDYPSFNQITIHKDKTGFSKIKRI